ncbi:MAG: hypothetical protein ACLU4N_07640 [Butyricimonas faecihominis]
MKNSIKTFYRHYHGRRKKLFGSSSIDVDMGGLKYGAFRRTSIRIQISNDGVEQICS